MPGPSLVRDLATLVALASGLALGHLALRIHGLAEPGLAWIADEPVELGACELGEAGLGEALGDEAQVAAAERIAAVEALGLHGRPGVVFVDARPSPAFAGGHVPGAICLPSDEAAAILGRESVAVGPDDLVIAYCEGLRCERSEALARLLREHLGCRSVRVLEGGWPHWLAAGGPVDGDAEGGRG